MRALFKDTFKTISSSKGRFIALLLIVALGSGFYASLQMTRNDMLATIDKYYDDSNLMDIRIVSTIGVDEDDLDAVSKLDGVEDATLAHETDIIGTLGGEQITMRIHSIEGDASINKLNLVEGRMPQRAGECVISSDCVIGVSKNIGEKIVAEESVGDIDTTLSVKEFEIVGKIESPLYISFTNPSTTTLGSGQLQDYIYVHTDSFALNYPYSEIYLTVKGAKEVVDYEANYQERIDRVKQTIEEISTSRVESRSQDLKDQIYNELSAVYGGSEVALNAALETQQSGIDELDNGEWIVADRTKIWSVESYRSDADRIDSIAKVFPLFFFLVAALVALTTMTRMIEEERLSIGTYKALGYSRRAISLKFLIYAMAASTLGSIIGITLLSHLLPKIIMVAYSIIYRIPQDQVLYVDPYHFVLSLGVGVGLCVAVTLIVTWRSLHEVPSSLMRPKVDMKGSRILLERVGPFWRRMSFAWKVTLRNLLRYKRRSAMTIIGIGGCTALLLTGFGLSNSINDIIDKQFGETIHYNTILTKSDDISGKQDQDLQNLLDDKSQVDHYANVEIAPIVSGAEGKKDHNVTLIVPQNFIDFERVWNIRDRVEKRNITLSADGVLICEKLSNLFEIKVGDEISLYTQDNLGNPTDRSIKVRVDGIFENYVGNYIIAPSEVYLGLFDRDEITFSSSLVDLADHGEHRTSFADRAREGGGVKTIAYNDETISTYRNALKSVDMVVVVLVVCAAILASIVLFNLNNINILERRREIATLQVLGFRDREVTFYIYRETIILTILGCILGLCFGMWLEGFVVTSAEVTSVMFGRDIHFSSFLLASGITLIFSIIIMFLMRGKFTLIDMVESLKSAE